MIGIYKITNLINGRSYIGQSRDIDQRLKEHLYHKQSPIDFDIHSIGKDNFKFEILEECSVDDLDSKEDYYIQLYDSINNGYNIIRGGQHNIGESNSNVKLTESDVYNIREAYNNHESRKDVYESYRDKITFLSFANIWSGVSWKHVHMDVYTELNKKYYSSQTTNGENGNNAAFTNQEVHNLRERYVNETAKSIYEDYKDRCSYDTFCKMLWGHNYTNVRPVYNKKTKYYEF